MAATDERLMVLAKAKKVREELDGEASAAAGVKFNQAVVLSQIALLGSDATVSQLAAALDRAVHTLTSAVNGLEKQRLVQRLKRKGEDRRIIRIQLTSQGDATLKRLRQTSLPLPQ